MSDNATRTSSNEKFWPTFGVCVAGISLSLIMMAGIWLVDPTLSLGGTDLWLTWWLIQIFSAALVVYVWYRLSKRTPNGTAGD